MAVLGAPVFPHGNLAFFVAIFSEMTRLSAGVGLHLHSIHPSITRESKWRYIMKKINLRELYPDVYTTDFFVDVTEEVMETFGQLNVRRLRMSERCIVIKRSILWIARMALKMRCC